MKLQSTNNNYKGIQPTFGAVPKYKVIDMATWTGKNVFERYNPLKYPFFAETVDLDVTDVIKFAQEKKIPPNLIIMYAIGKAINSISQFKIRKLDDKLVEFEKTCLSFPVQKRGEEGGINFCEFDYNPDLDSFISTAKEQISTTKRLKTQSPGNFRPDATYMSYIDCHYKSLTNPNNGTNDIIPRINWGKPEEFWRGNPMQLRSIIPLTTDINHGLVTQFHISKFREIVEDVFKHAKADTFMEKLERAKYFSKEG